MFKFKNLIIITLVLLFVGMSTISCKVSISTEDHTDQIQTLSDGRMVFPPDIAAGDTLLYLKALQKDRDYHIIIDNFGGSAFDTMVIINRIDELQKKGFTITTETYGYAMSGGAFIFIMGDRRIIHDGAAIMFHGAGFIGPYGQRQSLRSLALTGKTTLKPEQVKSLSIIDNKFMKMLTIKIALRDAQITYWMYKFDYNFMSSDEAMRLGVATELG